MPKSLKFDEIEQLKTQNRRSIPYDDYFGNMRLTESQKKQRKEVAIKLENLMLFFFSLVQVQIQYGQLNKQSLVNDLSTRYKQILTENNFITEDDEYIQSYIEQFSKNALETTLDNLGKEYYTSEDRAMYMAENEANTIANHNDYINAKSKGYSRKKWIAENDDKVRSTHQEVDNVVANIDDYFVVGDTLMRYPKDYELAWDSAQETVNCRCSIEYLK